MNKAILYLFILMLHLQVSAQTKEEKCESGKTVSVSTQQKVIAPTFSIHPNPANSSITLTGLTEAAVIYDMLGNEVMHIEKDGEQDISGLKEGIYFIHSNKQARKFVKS
ncbi:MAG: T9SS type A sorting domain-containing protein [Bacteroidota bacterium]